MKRWGQHHPQHWLRALLLPLLPAGSRAASCTHHALRTPIMQALISSVLVALLLASAVSLLLAVAGLAPALNDRLAAASEAAAAGAGAAFAGRWIPGSFLQSYKEASQDPAVM